MRVGSDLHILQIQLLNNCFYRVWSNRCTAGEIGKAVETVETVETGKAVTAETTATTGRLQI